MGNGQTALIQMVAQTIGSMAAAEMSGSHGLAGSRDTPMGSLSRPLKNCCGGPSAVLHGARSLTYLFDMSSVAALRCASHLAILATFFNSLSGPSA